MGNPKNKNGYNKYHDKLKNELIELGMYERGMNPREMEQILHVVKSSSNCVQRTERTPLALTDLNTRARSPFMEHKESRSRSLSQNRQTTMKSTEDDIDQASGSRQVRFSPELHRKKFELSTSNGYRPSTSKDNSNYEGNMKKDNARSGFEWRNGRLKQANENDANQDKQSDVVHQTKPSILQTLWEKKANLQIKLLEAKIQKEKLHIELIKKGNVMFDLDMA